MDTVGVGMSGAWTTTTAECKTSLYVSAGAFPDMVVRRYTLKSTVPCELVRDTTFGETAARNLVVADDTGAVFIADFSDVARVAPGARVTCSTSTLGFDATEFDVSTMTIARDGSVGFAGFVKRDNGGIVDRKIAKITSTADGCTLSAFATTGGTPLGGINGLVIDSTGRLHVADDSYIPKGNKRVVIYDPNGAFVSTYNTRAAGATFQSALGLTLCRGGLCVDEFFHEIGVSEDGVFRGEGDFTPPEGINGHVLAGSANGPLFVVANKYASPAILVSILKDR